MKVEIVRNKHGREFVRVAGSTVSRERARAYIRKQEATFIEWLELIKI